MNEDSMQISSVLLGGIMGVLFVVITYKILSIIYFNVRRKMRQKKFLKLEKGKDYEGIITFDEDGIPKMLSKKEKNSSIEHYFFL